MSFDRFHIGDPEQNDHFAVTPDEKASDYKNEDVKTINDFHAHLEVCDQCRTQPFGLCSEGAALLLMIKP